MELHLGDQMSDEDRDSLEDMVVDSWNSRGWLGEEFLRGVTGALSGRTQDLDDAVPKDVAVALLSPWVSEWHSATDHDPPTPYLIEGRDLAMGPYSDVIVAGILDAGDLLEGLVTSGEDAVYSETGNLAQFVIQDRGYLLSYQTGELQGESYVILGCWEPASPSVPDEVFLEAFAGQTAELIRPEMSFGVGREVAEEGIVRAWRIEGDWVARVLVHSLDVFLGETWYEIPDAVDLADIRVPHEVAANVVAWLGGEAGLPEPLDEAHVRVLFRLNQILDT